MLSIYVYEYSMYVSCIRISGCIFGPDNITYRKQKKTRQILVSALGMVPKNRY